MFYIIEVESTCTGIKHIGTFDSRAEAERHAANLPDRYTLRAVIEVAYR